MSTFPQITVTGPATHNAVNAEQLICNLNAGDVTVNLPPIVENSECEVYWDNASKNELTINAPVLDDPRTRTVTTVTTISTKLVRGLVRFMVHDGKWRVKNWSNLQIDSGSEFGWLRGTWAPFAPGSSPTPITGWQHQRWTEVFDADQPNASTGVLTAPIDGVYNVKFQVGSEQGNDKKEFSIWLSIMSNLQGNTQVDHEPVDSDKTTYRTFSSAFLMQLTAGEELRLGMNWEGSENPGTMDPVGLSSFELQLVRTEVFPNGGLIGS